jgi:hypothetical protein
MHRPHDTSSATIARQRAFGDCRACSGAAVTASDIPIIPSTTVEC